jgi:(p)ppGpp synthase/HD superfamily hydrolase
VNIKKAQVRLSPDHTGILDFELTLNNLEQFKKVLRVIQAIPDIICVERRNKVKKR